MKLTGARIETFLQKPDPAVVAVLFYGPDQGLVRERADRLVSAVTGDPADPFRVAEVATDIIKENRARLSDEAAALPFSGGRRVVRIRDGKDALTPAVSSLFDAGAGDGLVIIEASELAPRSTLRQLFEKADRGAAIACYLDDADTVKRVVAEELGRHGITPSAEAADLLAVYLGADRGVTRSELEKVALYRGVPGRLEGEDVIAVVADAGAVSLDAIAAAACDGDLRTLDRGLQTAAGEGVSAIGLLRTMARYLQRLLQARTQMAGGKDVSQAMAAVRPPVFFRLQPQFRRQLQVWDPESLGTAFTVVADTELACKRTGAPQELLCQRAFIRLAELARAARRR